jgi:gliding motility-associated-like protein
MKQVKSKLLLFLLFCVADSIGVCSQSCENTIQVIDTFCTGTRYLFGDTLILNEGLYTKTFKDIDDCDSIVNLDLRETPNVTFNIDIDTLAPSCLGDSLGGFRVNVQNAVEPIQYAILDGFLSFNQVGLPLEEPQTSNVFEELTFGRYTLIVIDRFGCGGLANINLTLQPVQGAIAIDTICEGSSIIFGDQLISDPGIYVDTMIGSKGCDSVITLDLRVEDFDTTIDFALLPVPVGCMPNELGSIEVSSISGGSGPYEQFINGDSFATIATDLEVGTYEIRVEDRFECHTDRFIEVGTAENIFQLSIDNPETINLGESVNIDITASTPIETFTWSSIPSANCPDCLAFSFSPIESFEYVLNATNQEGCKDIDTLSVVVLEGQPLFIPDIIKPNSALQENQIFSIFANPLAVQSVNNLSIFDRYGNQVFSNPNLTINDVSTGWNGTFNGNFVEQGVYSYRADVQFVGGQRETILGSFLVVY